MKCWYEAKNVIGVKVDPPNYVDKIKIRINPSYNTKFFKINTIRDQSFTLLPGNGC